METNFEHYKDEILKITNFSSSDFALNKKDRTLAPCEATECEDCLFDCIRTDPHQMIFNCRYRALEWASAPYVPLITKLEHDFLKNYTDGYKYIYRKNNNLYLAMLPPETDNNIIFGISGLNVNFSNIKENECYAINDLITAHTAINCAKE
jgi:hypothetical protein